jgi:mitochondrial cardiolipin hydrolase
MMPDEIDARLARSLDDRRFSRGERQALVEWLATSGSSIDREEVRRRAFELARAALGRPDDVAVLAWLEEVIRATREVGQPAARPAVAEAYFSPGDECPRAIGRLLASSKKTADICVFTITDDRLSDAILDAHRRGVAIRIIADDAKAEDQGSDIERFERSGIPTRVDRSPFHMHHKFAILDGATLLTGSYNWTRGAARDNEENLIVTTEPRLLAPFNGTFERLWAKLDPTR